MYVLINNPMFGLNENLPISIAQVKEHMKYIIDSTDTSKDQTIRELIWSAVEFFEKYTGRCFFMSTWNMYLDYFPRGPVEFKKKNVKNITSFGYYDNTWNMIDDRLELEENIDYFISKETDTDYARIVLKKHLNLYNIPQNIRISAEVGMYSDVSKVSSNIKQALKMHVTRMLTTKGDDCADCETALTPAIQTIYNQYKIMRF